MTAEPAEPPFGWNDRPKSALQQEAIVPKSWKPTPTAPVPVVRCVTIKKDGERCGRWSIRGHTKCYAHLKGATSLPNFQAHTAAVIEAARLRLVDNADMAIDTLEALLQPGTAEAIRLKASTEILDRVGVRGGFDVEVKVDNSASQVDEIRERLAKLNSGNQHREELESADIVDADVIEVEDNDFEQDTLF